MDKLKALIVDDSKVMRLMVMKALRQSRMAEFQFEEAHDGQDGLEKIVSGDYRIVFADINMPRMSGIDMVREVRAAGLTKIFIVMITSDKALARADEAMDEAGADAFIAKPFTVERLQKELGDRIADLDAAPTRSGGLFSRLVSGR